MPNKLTLFLGFFQIMVHLCNGQSSPLRTRFDAYIGVGLDAYQSSISDNWLSDAPVGTLATGFEAEIEYADHFSAGLGLVFKPYAFGFNYTDSNSPDFTETMRSFQVPIFVKARKQFNKRDASVYALGGAALGFNLDYKKAYPHEVGTGNLDGNIITSDGLVVANFRKLFPLVFLGAGIETRIFNQQRNPSAWPLRAGLSCRRYIGFLKIMETKIDYFSNEDWIGEAAGTHYGGYWMFCFHLIFAIER